MTKSPTIEVPPDVGIRFLADSLDDQESTRKALANRLRNLNELSGTYGYLKNLLDATEKSEEKTVKRLEKTMKEHDLYPWMESRKGVGPKGFARFLGCLTSEGGKTKSGIEIPPSGISFYYTIFEGEKKARRIDRNLYKLFAYCGFDPNRKKEKGKPAKWNHKAKTRLYVIADAARYQRCAACTAQGQERGEKKDPKEGTWIAPPKSCTCAEEGFEERVAYDQARAHWRKMRPDATPGHKENHALRMVSKGLLKDLYNEALYLEI